MSTCTLCQIATRDGFRSFCALVKDNSVYCKMPKIAIKLLQFWSSFITVLDARLCTMFCSEISNEPNTRNKARIQRSAGEAGEF